MAIHLDQTDHISVDTTIRFFLSSTFVDFQVERNILQERVFPALRTVCAQSGFRLQPIDLRWGVSEEAAAERQTLRICFDELEHCRHISPDFFLLIQLGSRYGSHILPSELPAQLVARVIPYLTPDERRNFDDAYQLDENAIPPEYALLRTEGPARAEDETLRLMLARAGHAAGLSEAEQLLFEASATYREIQLGLLGTLRDQGYDDGVLCAVRSFRGEPRGAVVERFTERDHGRAEQVRRLTASVTGRLPEAQVLHYAVDWPDEQGPVFEQAEIAEHYLAFLRPKLEAVIATRTQARAAAKARGRDATARANATFEAQRAEYVEGREAELARLAEYLSGRNGAGEPLVVTGTAGSGKSTLLAEAAKRVATQGDAALVVRYIGVTPGTTNLAELLNDLRRAIGRAYGGSETLPLVDLDALCSTLATELSMRRVPPERPLLLLVDGIDQLGASAQRTDWLPSRLAPGVRVVVSVLADRPELSALRARLSDRLVLTLGPLTREAGKATLRHLLEAVPRRTLTSLQEEAVLSAFAIQGIPLYLRVVIGEVRRWRSFDVPLVGASPLPQSTPALLDAILARLEAGDRHGRQLVAEALGDLWSARTGLVEGELLDLLGRDKAVRNELRKLSPNSPEIGEGLPLPVALWARLYTEIGHLLSEREVDNLRVYTFYHQQLRTAIEARYLSAASAAERHRALASYFADQPWQLAPREWNWRKVRELLAQQDAAGDRAGAERSLDELVDAIERAESEHQDYEGVVAVVEALDEGLAQGRHHSVGQRIYELQLAAATALGDRVSMERALNNLGLQVMGRGHAEEARHYFEQALTIQREIGDWRLQALTLGNLGVLADNAGQAADAQRYFEQALAIWRDLSDRYHEANTLSNLGLSRQRSQPQAARRLYDEALQLWREVGDRAGEARTLNNLGTLEEQEGRPDTARRCYEQALGVARAVGDGRDHSPEGTALNNLGALAQRQGRLNEATRYYEQTLTIWRAIGVRDSEGKTLDNLAGTLQRQGRLEEAIHYSTQELTIWRELEDRAAEASTLDRLGLFSQVQGEADSARRYFEQALAIWRELGERTNEGITLTFLGELAQALGMAEEARFYLEEALVIFEALNASNLVGLVRQDLQRLSPVGPKRRRWPFGQ
jgi:tetratricopeptide (TPR) repeat protein